MFRFNAKGISGGQTLEQKVVDFPVDPRDLPNCGAIYKDDEPQSIDEQNILQHKAPPLRKSNRMVRPGQAGQAGQAVAPAFSSMVPVDPGYSQFMHHQQMMFTHFMQQQQQQQQAQQQGGNNDVVQLLKPNPRRQKALPPPPTAEEAVVPASENPTAAPSAPAAPAASPTAPPPPIAPPPTPKASEAASLLDLSPLDPEALERTTDGHRDAKKGTVHKRPATTQQVVSKAKASSKAKAKAGAKASNKAKAGAKAGSKAKAGAKAGSKAKAGAKSGLKPVVDRVKHKGGWTVEVRQRPTGQRDKSYIGPNGQVYRMQHEAESAGFVAK